MQWGETLFFLRAFRIQSMVWKVCQGQAYPCFIKMKKEAEKEEEGAGRRREKGGTEWVRRERGRGEEMEGRGKTENLYQTCIGDASFEIWSP